MIKLINQILPKAIQHHVQGTCSNHALILYNMNYKPFILLYILGWNVLKSPEMDLAIYTHGLKLAADIIACALPGLLACF